MLAISLVASYSMASAIHAPQLINYQAQFMKSPTKFEDRELDLRFSFWSTPGIATSDISGSGAINQSSSGFAEFIEVFNGITPNIEGVVNLELGSTTPLPKIKADRQAYMQVEVKLRGESDDLYEVLDIDGVLQNGNDRRALVSVPYALNADTVDGHDVGTSSGDIVELNEDAQFDKSVIPDGTNEDSFVIDSDNSAGSGNVSLGFGSGASISYNPDKNKFSISDTVNLNQNELENIVIHNAPMGLSGAVAGQLYYNTGTTTIHYFNGMEWIEITGSGAVSPESVVMEPEFGATFTADETDNKGSMEADMEPDGTAYYKWSSNKQTLQDIDMQAHITIPKGFTALSADDQLVIEYLTAVEDELQNKIEITAFNPDGSQVTLIANSGTTTRTSSGTWEK